MRKRFYGLMACLLFAGTAGLAGTGSAKETELQEEMQVQAEEKNKDLLAGITEENYPRVDGSTATLPLSSAVYRLVTGASVKESDEAVVHTKTTNSYLRLINGEVDLLIAADKNEAVDEAAAQAGVELEIRPIALDAFVFLANEDNPVKSLTKEQIQGIYSGQITNWSQLGGEDKDIIPFQRNENAGSQTAMKSLVMQGMEMIPAEKLEIATMSSLLEAVAAYNNDANALGYSYYYYANLMYQTPGLRFMAVDGVEPSNESVQSGAYPYIATYYAVIRREEAEDTPARRIFEWLTTVPGQELAADLGYIPVNPEVKPRLVHTQESEGEQIPIADDERLAVSLGEYTAVVLDKEGRIVDRLENAQMQLGNYGYERVKILSGGDTVPVSIKTGAGGEDYLTGLYDVGTGSWRLEPVYHTVRLLGNGLCSNTDIMEGAGGVLMRTDGTVLAESSQAFVENGNFITDGQRLFDLDGNYLRETEGYIINVVEDCLITSGNNGTQIWNPDGSLRAVETSGLYVLGVTGGMISWVDSNQAGVITDINLQPVITQGEFYQRNQNWHLDGSYFMLVDQSPDGQYRLVEMLNADYEMRYYLCDSEYRILEEYIEEICGTRQEELGRWIWKMDGSMLCLTSLWDDGRLETEFPWEPVNGVTLERYGEIVCISGYDGEWNVYTAAFTPDGPLEQLPGARCILRPYTDDIVTALYNDSDGNTRLLFYLEDGTFLAGDGEGSTLFANREFRCVQYGSYLYVEDYEGNLYCRILCEDEEISEPEEIPWW